MFTLTAYRGEPLMLDPGPWIVQVRLPGHRPAELFGTAIPGTTDTVWPIAVAPLQVPVDLRFSPPSVARRAHLTMTSVGDPTPRVIERDLTGPALTMTLPVGTYQLDVEAGRREAHIQIVIAPGQGPILVELRRNSRPAVRYDRDEKTTVAFGILALAQLTAGLGLLIGGGTISGRAYRRNERLVWSSLLDDATGDADGLPGLENVEARYPTAAFHDDHWRGLNLEIAGVAVLAGAFGVVVPALLVESRAKRRVAYIEMAAGAAILAGGAVWMADFLGRRERLLGPDDPVQRISGPDLNRLSGHGIGAAALTGLGIGLVVFPAITLLTDRRYKRRHGTASLAPWGAPGLAGLSLRGRF
jgi:hypothetical protein